MNKGDLSKIIVEKTGATQVAAGDAMTAVFDAIVAGLVRGEDVNIAGFGTFKVIKRKARKARNPKTGETIDVPASKGLSFRAAKGIKEKLN